MKKLSLIIAMMLVASACLAMTACNVTAKAESFVAIDINPSIELILDGNGKVMSVKAANEDAEVMLYNSDGIIGQSLEVASAKIAELAKKYNYVTAENSEIGVTVSALTGEAENKIFEKINQSFAAGFADSGLNVNLTRETGVMLQKELERLKAAHAGNAHIQKLSVGRLRLIKSAMLSDKTLTIEAAAALGADELADIIKENRENVKETLGKTYEYAVEKAEAIYEQAKASLTDAAYITVAPLKGAEYVALRAAYFALEQLEEFRGDINAAVSEEDVSAIAEMLGLAGEELTKFQDYVKNSDGAVTEDSIEYYIDTLCRNLPKDEAKELEKKLDAVEDYLEELEEKADVLTGEALETVNKHVEALKLLGIHLDGDVATYEDIEDKLLETLEDRIEAVEKWFDKNLSENEKKQVTDIQKGLSDKLAELQQVFQAAVEDAKKQAEAYLSQMQAARITIEI